MKRANRIFIVNLGSLLCARHWGRHFPGILCSNPRELYVAETLFPFHRLGNEILSICLMLQGQKCMAGQKYKPSHFLPTGRKTDRIFDQFHLICTLPFINKKSIEMFLASQKGSESGQWFGREIRHDSSIIRNTVQSFKPQVS